MFEMSFSLSKHMPADAFSTHVSVANALPQTTPGINQSLLVFIDIVDPYFIDSLYNFPNFIVNEVQVRAVGWP